MIDYREMIWNRNKFIALTVVIVILSIIFAVALDMPSGDRVVASGYYAGILIGEIIKVAVAMFMIIMTLVALPALKTMLAYYGQELLKEKSEKNGDVRKNIRRFAGSVSTLIALTPLWIATAYVFDFAGFSILTFVDVSYSTAEAIYDWSGYLPLIIFIPVILVAVIKCIIAITVVSGAEGRTIGNSISEKAEENYKSLPEGRYCPGCNALNALNARFCSSCGVQMRSRVRM